MIKSVGLEEMMNKTPKSKKRIINAFIELRAKKPLEKITVIELCEKADVNKSTFYTYYHDIYDLSDQLEEEMMQSIINSLPSPEMMFEKPGEFARHLANAYHANYALISILFSGSRSANLPRRIEQSIKDLYYSIYPDKKNDIHTDITLSYKIYGGYYAYFNNENADTDKINVISELAEKI